MNMKTKAWGRKVQFWAKISLISILWGLAFTGSGAALDYPSKAIQVVVGYAPGGPASLGARIVSEEVSKEIGVPLVIINKAGGQGSIAATFVARAKPDGYTLLAGTSANLSAAFALLPDITYKLSDFMPIAQHVVHPLALAVRSDAPWKSLREFVDDARNNPGKYKASSDGGGIALCLEALLQSSNIKVPHMLCKGAAPNLQALLGGETQFSAISLPSLLPQLEAGKVRLLAISGKLKQFPNTPSIAEMGYTDVSRDFWNGFFAPAGTPQPVFEKLSQVFKKTITSPSTVTKLEKAGFIATYRGPKEFNDYLQREYEIWVKLGSQYKISE
jgi:tripartite-type tricarboxylate transporter receptor subunit TctC